MQICFFTGAALLCYTYAGYPLLLLIVSRLRSRPIRRAEWTPHVSVIITAYNEERDIAAKLENTLALDYPAEKLEIIVASDGSGAFKTVQAAIDSIPEQFQPYLENTVFVLEELSPEGLMGLYEGAGALASGEGMPERITLFKRSHEQSSRSFEELVEEVRRTILHEVGHHFGMEEDDLPY